jgi:hypothetical protein
MSTGFGQRVNPLALTQQQDGHAACLHTPQFIFRQLSLFQDRLKGLGR